MLIKNGNLLNTTIKFIGHQVNCQGVMGARVAYQLANKYPQMYIGYKSYVESKKNQSDSLLGKMYTFNTEDGHTILNIFGQDNIGYQGCHTVYNAYYSAFLELYSKYIKPFQKDNNFMKLPIAIPYGIGCGLAGGDWEIMRDVLENIERNMDIFFVAYKI